MRCFEIICCLVSFGLCVDGKVYERCELARELIDKHEAPMHQVATWVCIAEHESQYNTTAVGETNGDHSKDHGLFQISDLYWCSPPGRGACGLSCEELEDDNIEDDFICARRIYREHKILSGDGFNAWAVYRPYCAGSVESYIKGCFDSKKQNLPAKLLVDVAEVSTTTTTSQPTTSNGKSLSANSLEVNRPWFKWFSRFKWS